MVFVVKKEAGLNICRSGRDRERKRILVVGNAGRYLVCEKAKHVLGYLVVIYPVYPPFDLFPEGTDFFNSDMTWRPILVQPCLTYAPVNLVVNVIDLHKQMPAHRAVTSVTRVVLGDFFQLILKEFGTLDMKSLGYLSLFPVDYLVHKLCICLLH